MSNGMKIITEILEDPHGHSHDCLEDSYNDCDWNDDWNDY